MRAATSIATVAIALLLLSGCVPQPSPATPTPAASSTPVFASDEEALAAATVAYAAYVQVADQIFIGGGIDPQRLSSVATGSFLSASIAGFADIQSKKWRSTGGTTFDNVTLQKYDSLSSGPDLITLYLCEDVSAVDVFDGAGQSVVSSTRPIRTLLQVAFDLEEDHLLVSSREPWGGEAC